MYSHNFTLLTILGGLSPPSPPGSYPYTNLYILYMYSKMSSCTVKIPSCFAIYVSIYRIMKTDPFVKSLFDIYSEVKELGNVQVSL